MNFYSHSFSWWTVSPDKVGENPKYFLNKKLFYFERICHFLTDILFYWKLPSLLIIPCLANGQKSACKEMITSQQQSISNEKTCSRMTFSTTENIKEFWKWGHFYFRLLQTMLVFSKLGLKTGRTWGKERLTQGPLTFCSLMNPINLSQIFNA